MSVFQKTIRACDLPNSWQFCSASPDQLVVVTVSDFAQTQNMAGVGSQQRLDNSISSLAAPTRADKMILSNMSSSQQRQMYESAILQASAQSVRNVTREEVKAAALR